jgi:hypothetical protein
MLMATPRVKPIINLLGKGFGIGVHGGAHGSG